MTRCRSCIRLWLQVVALVSCLAALVTPRTLADGAPLPPFGYEADVLMPSQTAILLYDGAAGREDLILSVRLEGGPEAAWVVPVPGLPTVRTAQVDWFAQLSELTKPEVRIEHDIRYADVARCMQVPGEDLAPGVEVLVREQVGVYDVSVLAADDPLALSSWLDENGYSLPDAARPILADYVAEGGWHYVAARVHPEERAQLTGDVRPLWLSFPTERAIYPMRLTSLVDRGISILLYVLGDHRHDIDGFELEYAGPLQLEPVEGEKAALNDLLSGRPHYVTRLRAEVFYASEVRADLYPVRAASDDPYRPVYTRTIHEICPDPKRPLRRYQLMLLEMAEDLPPIVVVMCCLSPALFVVLGIWWAERRRRAKRAGTTAATEQTEGIEQDP